MSATCPEQVRHGPNRGFATTTVILILVMLAVFGTALVTTVLTQQSAASLDIQAARALQAARAGIEFGVYKALRESSCAGTSIDLGGGLSGFRVTVSCTSTGHSEGNAAVTMYRVTANGCNDAAGCPGTPGPTYVERELTAVVAGD